MKRFSVLNLWVDDCTMETALNQVENFVRNGRGVKTIFASNPEKNYSVPKNPFLHEAFRRADLLIPDGIGMVLAAGVLYGARLERVPGCELMQNICGLSAGKGYKIFIYGAKEEINRSAVDSLIERYPGVNIVGRQNGYLGEDEMEDLICRINASGAQILFLALGSPRQEMWISKYRDRLTHVRVCQGIGGTLDVLAGTVKRAPEYYCRLGLEWFYRLISEPSRIKRQSKLPLFAMQVAMEKIKPRPGKENLV
ncbi:MAG: WecB/TagA/CpsF family glycosyltransferase [Desulfobacula sp.]|nr:WecB/TagA/CpsF family glycosyltransferase [Desulfobacula sp.]